MLQAETDPNRRTWAAEIASLEMTRLRNGVALVTMRGRIEAEPAHFVIGNLPWLFNGHKSESFWDLSAVTSFSVAVPPIMVNGMIRHRALLGKLHMYTLSALLKATIVGSNLTLGSAMVHYGEQATFEAALAEALRA